MYSLNSSRQTAVSILSCYIDYQKRYKNIYNNTVRQLFEIQCIINKSLYSVNTFCVNKAGSVVSWMMYFQHIAKKTYF